MKNHRFYISPISKNVVDSILEFNESSDEKIGLIPSRRQVEWDGGYANNWTSETLRNYVGETTIKRDHAGPSQGYSEDDGFESLLDDCKYFNAVHIDPWKRCPNFHDGLEWTVKMIQFCFQRNPNVQYEIATEEAIRKFTIQDLKSLIENLRLKLDDAVFSQIKHVVIQSGTKLKGSQNTGVYDEGELIKMVGLTRSYGLSSKEHNGDYLEEGLVKRKFNLGLDSINIGPEFGLIETQTYIDEILGGLKETTIATYNESPLENFWKICYDTKRWEKWVDENFDPLKEKTDLIKICGHYVLSKPVFIDEIKKNFPDIDTKIKKNIKAKLNKLHE